MSWTLRWTWVPTFRFGRVVVTVADTGIGGVGTIKERLTSGHYSTFKAYTDDVDLVWANARAFNAPGDYMDFSVQPAAGQFCVACWRTGISDRFSASFCRFCDI